MTEQVAVQEVPEKKTLDSVELYRRNIRTMRARQMQGHLHRKVRNTKNGSMMDGAWAIILSTIFDNTTSSGVGGKLAPYLR